MAPNVTLHFFASNDLNGTPLLEITDEDDFFKSFTFKPKFQELGGAELVIARNVGFALFDDLALQPESFCRYLIHPYSDTVYYGGFFLDKRSQTVIHKDESGAEEFHFGGPGPKYYLDRSALGIDDQLGTDSHLDLDNGVWRWNTIATAGRILNYLLLQDAARTNPALPDLTNTFDPNQDSNGDTWTSDIAGDGDYEIPIGESYLDALWNLEDLSDLYTTIGLGEVGAPALILNAYNALGDDATSNVFASGKVLLREGVNIANDSLTLEGTSLKKPTHVIVEGKDGEWVVAVKPSFSSGDYVKWAKISHTRSSSHVILEKAGLNWLRNQELGEQELTVEILPGADDEAGLYFPNPDGPLWLGNSISVDTTLGVSHSPIDLNNEACLVTGFEVTTGDAGDDSTAEKATRSFRVKVLLNQGRGAKPSSPNQTTTHETGGGSCHCAPLCQAPVEAVDPSEVETLLYWFRANDAGGDSLNWVGILANQGGGTPGHGAEGTGYYYFKSSAPNAWSNVYPASAGTTLRISGYAGDNSTGERLKVGFFTTGVGNPGNSLFLAEAEHILFTGPTTKWAGFTFDYVLPAGTVGFALGRDGGGPSFDEIRIKSVVLAGGTAGQDGVCPEDVGLECVTGEANCAARGDHVHAHGNLSDDGLHHHNADDIEGGGGSGAPTTADYLVGTAQAGLSAEIVVGTTPGGELGGTWASPTVDATHSGSTHAAATAAAHPLNTGDPHTQYRLEADDHSHASSGLQGGTVAHSVLTGVTANQHHNEDHHTRHESGGADAVKLDDLAAPDDNTDLNASTSKHGLLLKLDGSTAKFLRADGSWVDPALSGGGGAVEDWDTVIGDLSGKVHRWKFEEASGNFADAIGSLTLTANGSISYSVATPLGNGVSFTGGFAESSGLGSIPSGDAERTIVIVWKKTAEGTVANPFPLFSYGAATTRQLFQLYGTAYATLRFSVSGVNIDASTPVGDGEWHMSAMSHIAATRQVLSAFFDGAQTLAAEGGNLATSTANNFHVGAEFDDTDPVAITVADVTVWDRYLGKPEMDRLYNALMAGMAS